MDLGREAEITALGRTWRVDALRNKHLLAFVAWVKDQTSNPFDALERFIDKVSPELAVKLIRDARELNDALKNGDWACELVQKHMTSIRGQAQLFLLQMKAFYPDIDLDTVLQILAEIGEKETERIRRTTEGKVPEGNGAVPAAGGRESAGTTSTAA